jgi:dCMP deaminase
MELKEAINQMYTGREKLILLGLTGRTGSGCSQVAKILQEKDFLKLDIRDPKSYDFKNSEERKSKVIYEYMKEPGRWNGFVVIEISSIILGAAMELGTEQLLQYIDGLTAEGNEKIISIGDKDSKLKAAIGSMEYMFKEVQKLPLEKFNDQMDDEQVDKYYKFYTDTIKNYKQHFKEILAEFTCFEIKTNKMRGKHQEQYHLYTFLMQQMGNNIRSSGNPFDNSFKEDKYREFVQRVNKVIKIINKWGHNKKVTSTRICIDAIRNPYEAWYFRDKYKAFHLMAISTEDDERKNRLHDLNEREMNNLDAVEYPNKMEKPQEVFYHQNIQGCLEVADIHVYNPDVKNGKYYQLTEQLVKYIALMLHPGLVTPTHLERCMQLAYNAKYNSGCLSRQVGAVVTREDFSIQSVGWNDVPKGQVSCNLRDVCDFWVNKDAESYSQFELEDERFSKVMESLHKKTRGKTAGRCMAYCFKDIYNGIKDDKNQVYTRALHAEENAFLQISKYGGTAVKGGCLFTTASPCELCAKKAYQLGIKEIYYIDPYPGISKSHILTFGKYDNPEMKLFYGAIGEAYLEFYTPKVPIKDELEMLTSVNVKNVVKDIDEVDAIKYGDIIYNEYIAEIEFVEGRNNIESTRTVCATMCREEITKIPKKMFWTGSTYEGTFLESGEKTDPDIKIVSRKGENFHYKYDVEIGKPRKKGEKLNYQTLTKVKDEKEVMEPYLAHMVKNKTEKLLLRVVAPENLLCEVVATIYADLNMDTKVKEAVLENRAEENVSIYEYSIDNANINYTYAIEWKFKK